MIDRSNLRKDAADSRRGLLQSVRTFADSLQDAFGGPFLRYLVLTYFGFKGVCLQLQNAAMLPYFQMMNVSGNTYQLANVVAMTPWSMKGWVGVLSDILPIGRYHKRGYLLVSSLIGAVGLASLASLEPSALRFGWVWGVAACFAAGNVMFSTFDLLCEGKYSEVMREHQTGSEVLTLVWSAVQLGGLAGALFVGVTVDSFGPRPILIACMPFILLGIWRTHVGDLPEDPARSWHSLRSKAGSAPGLFVCAGAMAAGSLTTAFCAAFVPRGVRNLIVVFVCVGLITLAFQVLPKTLARCNLYMFIISVGYLDVSGPLSYYYTGSVACVVDAPHFSYGYYIAVSNIVGSAFAVLGAVVFQFMQKWQFRTAFAFTISIQVLASVFDLFIIQRWNIQVGISDAATYLFGDAACQSIASQMQMMPSALLTARLCPRGKESTVFALLAGFQNFGNLVSSILGVQLAEALGVEASKDGPCYFDNLGLLVVISHCVIPITTLPLAWCLVPAARIDDEMAFEPGSPVPSFRSPAASPVSSPASSGPMSPADLHGLEEEYCLMQDDDGKGMIRAVSL